MMSKELRAGERLEEQFFFLQRKGAVPGVGQFYHTALCDEQRLTRTLDHALVIFWCSQAGQAQRPPTRTKEETSTWEFSDDPNKCRSSSTAWKEHGRAQWWLHTLQRSEPD